MEKMKNDESLSTWAAGRRWRTILVDPPWSFDIKNNRNAPDHARLFRCPTMPFDEIAELPIREVCEDEAFLWLWVPNALLEVGFDTLRAWEFTYKQTLTWVKTDAHGYPTRKGIGFYFQPMQEFLLFAVRGKQPRKLMTSTTESNVVLAPRTGHSRKPPEFRRIIEDATPGPRLELFSRGRFSGWDAWGDQADDFIGEAPMIAGRIRHSRLW